MSIVIDTNAAVVRVQDLTKEINVVGSAPFKEKALEYMSRFNFESTTDKSKCKHYPLDYLCDGSPEEKAKALEIIASTCWGRLLNELQAEIINAKVYIQEQPWDQRPTTSNVKIGKVYMCAPNRFSTVNTEVGEPKLFAFGYQGDNGYEVQGEVNFGIELY